MNHLLSSEVNTNSFLENENQTQNSSPTQTLNQTIHAAMHDVRSPLTGIKPYLDFLKKIDAPNKRHEILDRLKSSVTKMELIINGLVKYSDLICENSFELEKINSKDFKNIIQKETGINGYDSSYQLEFKELDFFSFSYPRGYFTEIIRILLDNSFKYQSTERELNITFSFFQKNGEIFLQIEDNGQGMPESFNPKIASHAFSKNTNPARGIGLGFPLIQTMVGKNGGNIDFEKKEEGTIVIIKMKSFEQTENQVLNFTNIKIGDRVDRKK